MDIFTYNQLRATIKTCDGLAVGGTRIGSSIIKLWTHSELSHIGMLVRQTEYGRERVYVYHALPRSGVHRIPASRYISQLKGEAWLLRLDHAKAAQISQDYETLVAGFMIDQQGRDYDYKGLGRFALPFIKQSRRNFFCSRLYAKALMQADLTLEDYVSPAALASDPIFSEKVYLG